LSDQAPVEEDDPVISSYPVYLTPSNAPSLSFSRDAQPHSAEKLFLLQYPAYRSADIPYNARNLQKPTSLRLKPSTGLLELDIPIDTKLNYNPHKGSSYATSLKWSRVAKAGGTHGLSGGFNTGPVGRFMREDEDVDMETIPAHSSISEEPILSVQTLGGKIVNPSPGDPIYMLGSFQNNSMHLSHLDALVQVRPQLPHLDAADELERNRNVSAMARNKGKDAAVNGDIPAPLPGPSTRPESKALDLKIKSNGPAYHDNDLSTNTNAKLLRAIQQEPWQTYIWIDEDEPESRDHAKKALHLHLPLNDLDATCEPSKLESAITNCEWLDLLSAPRIEHGKKGDKGLMGKVRGRERERQRRKRNEAARRERASTAQKETAAAGEEAGGSASNPIEEGTATGNADGTAAEDTADDGRGGPSDEESSEDDVLHQQDDHGAAVNEIQTQDTWHLPQTDGVIDDDEVQEVQKPHIAPGASEPAPARRRGRPRKSQPPTEPIVIED
jgi:RPC5 protein